MHQRRVVREPAGGVAFGPAAGVLQRLRQVPVVEGQPGLDAPLEQPVHQPGVEVQPGRSAGPRPVGCTRGQDTENRYADSPSSAISPTSSRQRW